MLVRVPLLEQASPASFLFYFHQSAPAQPLFFGSCVYAGTDDVPLSLSPLRLFPLRSPPSSSFCAGVATNNFALDELVEVSAPPAKKAKAKAKAE